MRNNKFLEAVLCLLFSTCWVAFGNPITDRNDHDFTFGLCGEYPANEIQYCSKLASEDIEVIQENHAVPPSVRIMRMHVDSIIQARFAHTVVTSHIQNFLPSAQTFKLSLPVPAAALVSGFSIQVDGNVYKAYPAEKMETFIRTTSQSSAVVNITDSMAADITLTLEARKVTVFKLIYEEFLSRKGGVYSSNVYLKPSQSVQDLQVRFLIYETMDIQSVRAGKLRNNKLYANATTTVFQPTARSAEVLFRPSVSDQAELAQVLQGRPRQGYKPEAGLDGHISVEYELYGYPTCGEIIVKDDHFVHFFSPTNPTQIPKHVVIVFATDSGPYDSVESFKNIIKFIASSLSPEDTFTIVQQGSALKTWDLSNAYDYYRTSDEDKCRTYQATSDFLKKLNLKIQGLTLDNPYGYNIDLGAALLKGLECASLQAELSNNQPMVVFLTQIADSALSDQVEQLVREANFKNGKPLVPIYSVGFGGKVDVGFLHRLSNANSGKSTSVPEGEDYVQRFQDFYEAVATPQLLKDVAVTYENHDVDQSTITNTNFRGLFEGTELVVAGQISKDRKEVASGKTELVGTVSAKSNAGDLTYRITSEDSEDWMPLPLDGTPLLERLWAFLKVTQRLDMEKFPSDLATPQTSKAKSEVTDLAIQYSFLTPTTCLLINREKPEPLSPAMPAAVVDRTTSSATKSGTSSPVAGSTSGPREGSTLSFIESSTSNPGTSQLRTTFTPLTPLPPYPIINPPLDQRTTSATPRTAAPTPLSPRDPAIVIDHVHCADPKCSEVNISIGTINIGSLTVEGALID